MPTVTLDSIRESIEKKYEPFVIDLGAGKTCVLRQVLAMPKEQRQQFAALQDEFNEIDQSGPDAEDAAIAVMERLLGIVAKTKGDADRLMRASGGDLAFLMEVITMYTDASQVGEASASPAS